jgi:nucleotide-binding universal stress UspA family protein
MYRSILIATDGSSRGDAAVRHGIDLAARLHAVVTVLFVIEEWSQWVHPESNPEAYRKELDGGTFLTESEAGRITTARAEALAREADVPIQTQTVLDEAAPAIVREAEQHDLVVLSMPKGHEHEGAGERLHNRLHPTLAAQVLERTDRPVLTVHAA